MQFKNILQLYIVDLVERINVLICNELFYILAVKI